MQHIINGLKTVVLDCIHCNKNSVDHARTFAEQTCMAGEDSKGADRYTFRRGCKNEGQKIAEALHAAGEKDRHAVQRTSRKTEENVLQALLLLFRRRHQQAA